MANQYKKWTKEEVIEAIKDFYKREGRTPLTSEFKRGNNLPSMSSANKVFDTNSIKKIYEYCGIKRTMTRKNMDGTIDFEWDIKDSTNRVMKFCKVCGRLYSVTLSIHKKGNKCCSKRCADVHRRENSITGVDNPLFKSVLLPCDICGKMHYKKPHKLKTNTNHFCSKECFNEWLAIRAQTDEWKKLRSTIAVNSLENGMMPNAETSIQIEISKLLDDLKINYKQEKGFKYYSIDLYLLDYDIPIEIMGDYWHTSHKLYDEINYEHQVDRIFRDKAKHNYLLNNHDVEILYLWEHDINNKLDVCKKLILKYIQDGKLENYHSFNYSIDGENLVLNNELEEPYMDMDAEHIKSITDLDVVKSRSRRDDSKHIKFECEYCGNEKEQLIGKYNKAKHHFCCTSCAHAYNSMVNGTVVNCKECGDEFTIKNSTYDRYKVKEFSCEKCKSNKKEN